MKIVASTIPGTEKITWNGRSPSQPPFPNTRISARPTTTGEIANGRSMIALSTPLPRNRPRASASAQSTPKTVLSGTAIAVTVSVSQNAEIAAGVVTESQTAPTPCSNVR